MFKKFRLKKRLSKLGTQIDVSYMLYINSLDPISFPTEDACFQYVKSFRQETEIFKLQIFRIETYSL